MKGAKGETDQPKRRFLLATANGHDLRVVVKPDLGDGCRQVQKALDRLGICGLSHDSVQVIEVHHPRIGAERKINVDFKMDFPPRKKKKRMANPQARYCPFGEEATVYP